MHITNNAIKFIRQRTLRKKDFFPFFSRDFNNRRSFNGIYRHDECRILFIGKAKKKKKKKERKKSNIGQFWSAEVIKDITMYI